MMTDKEKAMELLNDWRQIDSFTRNDMIGISCAMAAWKEDVIIEKLHKRLSDCDYKCAHRFLQTQIEELIRYLVEE